MKFSGYCFYMNTNLHGDFQICISVPLMSKSRCHFKKVFTWDLKWNFVSSWRKFKLLLIAGEVKYNFVSGVVGVNRPIKKCKQTRTRYRDKHVGDNSAGIYWRSCTLNQHSNWWKFKIFNNSTNAFDYYYYSFQIIVKVLLLAGNCGFGHIYWINP